VLGNQKRCFSGRWLCRIRKNQLIFGFQDFGIPAKEDGVKVPKRIGFQIILFCQQDQAILRLPCRDFSIHLHFFQIEGKTGRFQEGFEVFGYAFGGCLGCRGIKNVPLHGKSV
jgi:hypothetical protein